MLHLLLISVCLLPQTSPPPFQESEKKKSEPEVYRNPDVERAGREILQAVGQIDKDLFLKSLPFASATSTTSETNCIVKRKIVYSKVGERELLLDVYCPKKTGVYPAVLVVHGGAWSTGDRRQLAGYARKLTQMGMVCFAIDYRLAPQHKWPAQIEDCRSAVKWIRKHAAEYMVDASRLGAIGYSAGGHLVALLGTTGEAPSDNNGHTDTRLQAVAAGGAPVEFFRTPDSGGKWLSFLMGGDQKTVPEKYRSATPGEFIDKNDPPFFFYNGTMDLLVPLRRTKPLHEELRKHGVVSEMHVITGAGHALAAVNGPALDKAFLFLKKQLSQ